jgi:hypothetical protein
MDPRGSIEKAPIEQGREGVRLCSTCQSDCHQPVAHWALVHPHKHMLQVIIYLMWILRTTWKKIFSKARGKPSELGDANWSTRAFQFFFSVQFQITVHLLLSTRPETKQWTVWSKRSKKIQPNPSILHRRKCACCYDMHVCLWLYIDHWVETSTTVSVMYRMLQLSKSRFL